jgi:hypothetical protein
MSVKVASREAAVDGGCGELASIVADLGSEEGSDMMVALFDSRGVAHPERI